MKHVSRIPRLLAVTILLLAATIPCIAQDIPRWELFGGYSIDQTDTRAYFKSSTYDSTKCLKVMPIPLMSPDPYMRCSLAIRLA